MMSDCAIGRLIGGVGLRGIGWLRWFMNFDGVYQGGLGLQVECIDQGINVFITFFVVLRDE